MGDFPDYQLCEFSAILCHFWLWGLEGHLVGGLAVAVVSFIAVKLRQLSLASHRWSVSSEQSSHFYPSVWVDNIIVLWVTVDTFFCGDSSVCWLILLTRWSPENILLTSSSLWLKFFGWCVVNARHAEFDWLRSCWVFPVSLPAGEWNTSGYSAAAGDVAVWQCAV